MISIPMLSSSLLLLVFLTISADGRSTSPWKRRLPSLAARTPSTTAASNHLMLPEIRGGESSSVSPSSTPLPTPAASRIGDGIEDASSDWHILRGGKVDPVAVRLNGGAATSKKGNRTDVVVEAFVSKPEKQKQKRFHKQLAKQLKNRNATNKRRKFMHFTWGILFASLNHFLPRRFYLAFMTFNTGLSLTVELLRYRKGYDFLNKWLSFFLGKALRKNEMDGKFTGGFYYFSGVTLTSYLFPKPCAILGICQLAVADPTASYFGRMTRHVYWSRIGNGFFGLGRNKGLLGCLGGAICCVPLNYRLISLAVAKKSADVAAQSIAKPTVLAISLALGMAGALADLIVPTPALTLPKTIGGVKVPPFHLDDNFVVPVLSGWACVYIFKLAGIGDLSFAKYLVA